MAEIDETKIDRDFLAILRPKLLDFSHRSLHPMTIRLDGIWMVRCRLQCGAEKFLQGISWGKPKGKLSRSYRN